MRDFHRNMTFLFNCMSSDESPLTCEMFLDEGGLELFLTVLQVMCLTAIVIAQPSATSRILTSFIDKSKLLRKKLNKPNRQNVEIYNNYCRIFNALFCTTNLKCLKLVIPHSRSNLVLDCIINSKVRTF